MKISPLQMEAYFLTDLHVSANKDFDVKKEPDIKDKDILVDVECLANKDDQHKWQVLLKVQLQPPAEANVPYRFTLELVGLFTVLKGFPEDRIERLIRTNASSMLYGVAREVVRDFTSRGPYLGLILPSASFYEPEPKEKTAAKPVAKPIAKKKG
jgi:preprotein translocase subunit SecB